MKMIQHALSQFGVKEIKGDKHNPVILDYFKEIGHDWVNDDETAWCSCFINWCALKAGVDKSNKLNARSWLTVGDETNKPIPGDVVVFWRESIDSWKGHVGLYINEGSDYINVLGGNQNNSVSIKPYLKERLLGYRRVS